MLCDHGPGARVSKKVLLFTNRDDPLAPGEDGRELVAQWREYRNVHGIDVVLLPLPRTTTTTTTTLREGGRGRRRRRRRRRRRGRRRTSRVRRV
jgi:hypothetical protein